MSSGGGDEPWKNFPTEVVLKIMQYLSRADLLLSRLVSKNFVPRQIRAALWIFDHSKYLMVGLNLQTKRTDYENGGEFAAGKIQGSELDKKIVPGFVQSHKFGFDTGLEFDTVPECLLEKVRFLSIVLSKKCKECEVQETGRNMRHLATRSIYIGGKFFFRRAFLAGQNGCKKPLCLYISCTGKRETLGMRGARNCNKAQKNKRHLANFTAITDPNHVAGETLGDLDHFQGNSGNLISFCGLNADFDEFYWMDLIIWRNPGLNRICLVKNVTDEGDDTKGKMDSVDCNWITDFQNLRDLTIMNYGIENLAKLPLNLNHLVLLSLVSLENVVWMSENEQELRNFGIAVHEEVADESLLLQMSQIGKPRNAYELVGLNDPPNAEGDPSTSKDAILTPELVRRFIHLPHVENLLFDFVLILSPDHPDDQEKNEEFLTEQIHRLKDRFHHLNTVCNKTPGIMELVIKILKHLPRADLLSSRLVSKDFAPCQVFASVEVINHNKILTVGLKFSGCDTLQDLTIMNYGTRNPAKLPPSLTRVTLESPISLESLVWMSVNLRELRSFQVHLHETVVDEALLLHMAQIGRPWNAYQLVGRAGQADNNAPILMPPLIARFICLPHVEDLLFDLILPDHGDDLVTSAQLLAMQIDRLTDRFQFLKEVCDNSPGI
ncbi:hypothetical protein Fcan01_26012 [Folsomia candida]|uniref:F-box domain-containing protein n=1 Tax=Folsomia candida TaxID=158441 RepID=A0A226D4R0_FOLCA|nr:hypothetical protein Fcan01_26012 [Folsomia candida]